MANKDFNTTILTDKTPMEVYNDINKPNEWWPGEFEGSFNKVNDEFVYRYQEFHYSVQNVVELVPGKKVIWLITDSSLNFIKDKDEWTGTKIIFDIKEKNGKTEIHFTHEGLVPDFECYDACSGAWSDIISKSLASYLKTGKGMKTFDEMNA